MVEFDAGDGEAVAAVRCCRKRVHTRCFQQYLASATLVNETRMPCLYCRQCLGCLLPNGHCPVHGCRGQRGNVTRPVRRGHVGHTGGDEDAHDEDDRIDAGRAATGTRAEAPAVQAPAARAAAVDPDVQVWSAAQAAAEAGDESADIRAILRSLVAPPAPLPPNAPCPSTNRSIDARMRLLYRLWRPNRQEGEEWDGRRDSYRCAAAPVAPSPSTPKRYRPPTSVRCLQAHVASVYLFVAGSMGTR